MEIITADLWDEYTEDLVLLNFESLGAYILGA